MTMAIRGLEKLTVLVADDNRHMRVLLKSMMRAYGFRTVLEAGDGREALATACDTHIDILMADWAMTPMDGTALTLAIRRDPKVRNPYCTIIMVSGHAGLERVARARDSGVNSFLAKPVCASAVRAHLKLAFTDQRPFVKSPGFIGPDRRRARTRSYGGPLRRKADGATPHMPAAAAGADDAFYL